MFDKNKLRYFNYYYTFAIIVVFVIYINIDYKIYGSQTFSYSVVVDLLSMMSIVVAVLSISVPLSKIIASNTRFQQWYIKYKEKESMKKWRKDKRA